MIDIDVDTPIILADGTRIDPTTGKAIKDKGTKKAFVTIPSASEAQAIVARTRRSIADMPLPPQQMNSLSLILFYTLWGLNKNDIAISLGISIDQVKNIQALDQYKKLQDEIQKGVLEHEADDIRSYFKQQAKGAASKIVDIMEEDDGVLGFKAAQDVLDRAGHRPADVVEHRHSMENALQIEYIRKDNTPSVPIIDAAFEVINNGNH